MPLTGQRHEGVNYTCFFDEDTRGALKPLSIDLDDSWGLAGEVGLDYDLGNDWLISGQVWYIDIDTEADLKGVGKFDVDIDPGLSCLVWARNSELAQLILAACKHGIHSPACREEAGPIPTSTG